MLADVSWHCGFADDRIARVSRGERASARVKSVGCLPISRRSLLAASAFVRRQAYGADKAPKDRSAAPVDNDGSVDVALC